MNRWLTLSSLFLVLLGLGTLPVSARDYGDVMSGMRLTAEEAEALEARLDADAHDLQARSQLVVYYHGKSIFDSVIRGVHSRHVLWLIANAPQAVVLAYPFATINPHNNAEGYLEGKRAWLTHLEEEPTNVTFHGHAATFFSEFQDRGLVVETLRKVQSLDPDNSKWPRLLGHLYLRNAMFSRSFGDLKLPEGIDDDLDLPNGLAGLFKPESVDATASAVMALEQLQRAHELADSDSERRSLLGELATAAFQAERYEDARAHATSLLQSEPGRFSDGSEPHKANIVLGRVALIEDDVALASHHLLEAGKVEGSAPLGSFGPNMRLAADLLERGEKDVVLEYFELCSKFWPSEKLDDWAAMVKGGRMPDFGGNLVY